MSFGVTYETTPIYHLGRYNAAEVVYTGMGTVNLDVSGFRVMDNGPYEIAALPQLQELLNHEDIVITLVDRQDPTKVMLTVTGVRPISFSSTSAARSLFDVSMSYVGTTFSDESGPQEDTGAVEFG